MIRYIIPVVLLCTDLAQGMDAGSPDPLNQLRNILKEEKIKPGSFIKKITDDLKECTNGKMIELNYLTVKSSYWWDEKPFEGSYFQPHRCNAKKTLLIDRKFRSSLYDRERRVDTSICNLTIDKCVNSWESAREKVKFFENKDISPNTIPNNLKEIMGYGLSTNQVLDTSPSVFQLIRASKTLKYETKEPPKCPALSQEIAMKEPSEVISDGVKNILSNINYNRFMQQNHPLSKIVQDHLQKLKHKAEQNHFKPNESIEYQKPILYHKILLQMDYIIQLMSIFDIDIDTGKCDIPDSNKWECDKPHRPYYLYTQLYEVFNDLLFLLMSVDNHYTSQDFDGFLTNTYKSRFSVLSELAKNNDIIMASYPMRSGMDAFVNASMAIGHAPQDISIAPKVANLENTVYYEISNLLRNYRNRGDMKSAVFLSKKPSPENEELINDAFLRAYVDIQIDKNISAGKKEGEEIKLEEYMKKLIDSFQKNVFLDGAYKIEEYKVEQKGYNKERVSQCKEIINDILTKYSKLKNINIEAEFSDYTLETLKRDLEELDQLPNNEEQSNSKDIMEIMRDLSYFLSRQLMENFTPEFDPLKIYLTKQLTKQLQGEAKEVFFSKIKELLKGEKILPIQETEGEYYFEVPQFIMKKRKELFLKLKNQLPDLVDNTFAVDKHHSLTSGMTTDTIDPSGDPDFIDKLHRKINQIRKLKQDWNPSEDPFTILWDTTMEIDQGPCYALIDKFYKEIESGKIVFVLFKSLQKYANLGVGKSKAGVVTLIGKKVPIVENIHTKLTAYGKDVFSNSREYALMTFFHEPFRQDNEKLYYQAVRKHAQKIHSDEKKGMISGGCIFTGEENCKDYIPYADTFGFAIPTATKIENGLCRYSVGLNPKGLE